jgi:hypothetical protein
MAVQHDMSYRAGSHGFAEVGVPDRDPAWRCSCGAGWTFPAKVMPSRKTGNNEIEARRAHSAHVSAIR